MLSTAEKTSILRRVSIFSSAPEEVLDKVAQLLQPVMVRAGETIFNKGDPGDCMYIIVEGRVRVHDRARTLNYLATRDAFGEMAVLDAQPRSASVTAVKDTHLLRLDQATFEALADNYIEVAHGVIRVLRQYLRARLRDMAEDFEYIQQMERLTAAAAALEAGVYEAGSLEEVTRRTDALGQLARVFERMATEVVAREQHLRQQVQELRIEIDAAKKLRQVAEITDTEYFRELQRKVKQLRGGSRMPAPSEEAEGQ
ncbi:MAG: hypothetical protein KatS3mg057_2684 [Herpetosiphonaceae bacterium]|nr:MAG: hypothetical protein KatS3mg057_2684 [Herpetosiphonaceae bacterium]